MEEKVPQETVEVSMLGWAFLNTKVFKYSSF
jgi:hypothetical protein